ncbi:MAG: hypothetical protein PF904_11765 [Kiritimatiellae bacterium]|jgi:hypothetical protein|nr:hypothetical protein [Kiritimatiellia bacterium]
MQTSLLARIRENPSWKLGLLEANTCVDQQFNGGNLRSSEEVIMKRFLLAVIISPVFLFAETAISDIEELVNSDPKPFVIVEATGTGLVNRAQGVVISEQGDVLAAAHVSWIDGNKSFSDQFRISFRGTGEGLPEGFVHTHKAFLG